MTTSEPSVASASSWTAIAVRCAIDDARAFSKALASKPGGRLNMSSWASSGDFKKTVERIGSLSKRAWERSSSRKDPSPWADHNAWRSPSPPP